MPHQERVIEEKRELDERIEKLGNFFESKPFQSVGAEERGRMGRQFMIMKELSSVLGDRIRAFGGVV